ncbi:MAG: dihydroorotate dehydrogenase-like protein [Bacteroidales bacterium]|nr:dihydroorotate dehydrogenase-like protein [Bacteroidales bacterium]
MANLQTNYLGISLQNPIIVGASNLVDNPDNLKRIEDNGASAVVFKSLFEEQIQLEQLEFEEALEEYNYRHAEMTTLFPRLEHAGAKEHLTKLEKARKSLSIPLIGSLNAILHESWVEYARQLAETGIDALELNFYAVPKRMDVSAEEIENQQIEILKSVKGAVEIPVSVKLSCFYTNPLNFIQKLDKTGVDGVVIFNRFYQPDIDVQQIKHVSSHQLSTPSENKLALRFTGLLYGHIAASICANGGIHSGTDVVKMILAGADAVQVVSTIYQNKFEQINRMITELNQWMDSNGFASINDFKGKLSNKNIHDPFVYHRAQYIDLLLNSEHLLKRVTLP